MLQRGASCQLSSGKCYFQLILQSSMHMCTEWSTLFTTLFDAEPPPPPLPYLPTLSSGSEDNLVIHQLSSSFGSVGAHVRPYSSPIKMSRTHSVSTDSDGQPATGTGPIPTPLEPNLGDSLGPEPGIDSTPRHSVRSRVINDLIVNYCLLLCVYMPVWPIKWIISF